MADIITYPITNQRPPILITHNFSHYEQMTFGEYLRFTHDWQDAGYYETFCFRDNGQGIQTVGVANCKVLICKTDLHREGLAHLGHDAYVIGGAPKLLDDETCYYMVIDGPEKDKRNYFTRDSEKEDKERATISYPNFIRTDFPMNIVYVYKDPEQFPRSYLRYESYDIGISPEGEIYVFIDDIDTQPPDNA